MWLAGNQSKVHSKNPPPPKHTHKNMSAYDSSQASDVSPVRRSLQMSSATGHFASGWLVGWLADWYFINQWPSYGAVECWWCNPQYYFQGTEDILSVLSQTKPSLPPNRQLPSGTVQNKKDQTAVLLEISRVHHRLRSFGASSQLTGSNRYCNINSMWTKITNENTPKSKRWMTTHGFNYVLALSKFLLSLSPRSSLCLLHTHTHTHTNVRPTTASFARHS